MPWMINNMTYPLFLDSWTVLAQEKPRRCLAEVCETGYRQILFVQRLIACHTNLHFAYYWKHPWLSFICSVCCRFKRSKLWKLFINIYLQLLCYNSFLVISSIQTSFLQFWYHVLLCEKPCRMQCMGGRPPTTTRGQVREQQGLRAVSDLIVVTTNE